MIARVDSEAYIVPNKSRYVATLPSSPFTPQNVMGVSRMLEAHRTYILEGMTEGADEKDRALAGEVFDRDGDRCVALAGQHEILYGDAIYLLRKSGNTLDKVVDFGSRFARHLAIIPREDQPSNVICIDNDRTVVRGLSRVLEVFKKEHRIPSGYKAQLGDENTILGDIMDVIIHNIGLQYVDSWGFADEHSDTAVFGEVMHSHSQVPVEIATNPAKVMIGEVIPIISDLAPKEATGYGWRITSEPTVLPDGQAVYEADFVINARMYESDAGHAFVTIPKDSYHAQVNIFETPNKGLRIQSWRIQMLEEGNTELAKATAAVNEILTTGFEAISDTTRILLIPGRAVNRGWHVVERLTTEAGKFLPTANLVPGIAGTYRPMISELANNGKLRCVGRNGYKNVDELYKQALSPDVLSQTRIQRPVTISVTAFRKKEAFDQYLEALPRAV